MIKLLSNYDEKTAAGILAAAALNAGDLPKEERPPVARQYENEANALLAELRVSLALDEHDFSDTARSLIDTTIAKAIRDRLNTEDKQEKALLRAAQAGLLTPAAYSVAQLKDFTDTFGPL